MQLVIFSPSDKLDSEVPVLLNLFENGLTTYHVRKTRYSTRQLKNYIQDIPEKYHNRIVIHTHHKLAGKFRLKGIYVSHVHKKRKIRLWFRLFLLKLKRTQIQTCTSFRDIEAICSNNYKHVYDYVFLAPIFSNLTGKYHAGFSEYNLRSALNNTKYKVIARGGVCSEKILKAKEMGFAGVAFYTAIWKSKNPVQEFIKIKEKFEELGIPIE